MEKMGRIDLIIIFLWRNYIDTGKNNRNYFIRLENPPHYHIIQEFTAASAGIG
jgi:hypothetical protein